MKIFKAILPIVFCIATAAQADLGPLIPREVLFGNPERANPRISPDATRMAWIAPDKKNVLQVWVKTIGKDDDKMVTADKKRGVRQYFWAPDNKTILYVQDNDGDENFHVHGVDLTTANDRDFTAIQGVRAGIVAVEPNTPSELLVSLNARVRSTFIRPTLSTARTNRIPSAYAWRVSPPLRLITSARRSVLVRNE